MRVGAELAAWRQSENGVKQHGWLLAPFVHYSIGVFGGDVKFNGGQAASGATVSFLQVGAALRH